MKDSFVESQWQELCDHLESVADHLGVPKAECASFRSQEPPARYPDLLDRVRQAAQLADTWRGGSSGDPDDPLHDQERIDEAGRESFPASDPPTFSHAHA